MKRFFGSIIVALCLCVGVAYAANDYNLTPEIASAYFEVVDGLAAKNDLYLLEAGNSMYMDGYEEIFWDARLVDFDGDKVPELFFIYDPAGDVVSHQNRMSETVQYQVWGWNGHDAYQIAIGQPCSRVSGIYTDGFMEIKGVLYEDGRAYLPKMTLPNGTSGLNSVLFYTMENGKWVSSSEKFMRAEDNLKGTGPKFINATIDGKSVTSQQYEQRLNEINRNIVDVWNTGLNYYESLPKYKQFANQVNMPITITSNVDTVQIDGKPVKLQFYNVGDRNYIRLRDLAAAMKNTKKPFDVQWLMNVPRIIPDVPYQGSMQKPVAQTKKAQRDVVFMAMMSKKQYDDLVSSGHLTTEVFDFIVRALNINDENYVLLRDIGKYVDFSVDWDSTTGTVIINTSKEYTG